MASIGPYTMHRIDNGLPSAGVELESIERTGYAGVAYASKGWRPRPGSVRSTAYVTAAALPTTMNGYMLMSGALVFVNQGAVSAWYVCRSVRFPVEPRAVKLASGGSLVDRYQLVAEWELEQV